MSEKIKRTLAYRNRNPLNIRKSNIVRWQGQTGDEGGFVRFRGFESGYRAAVKILRSYNLRGIKTIGAIIKTWAPESENDTKAYVRDVLDYMNGVFRLPSHGGCEEYCARTQINLRDREEVVNLLMAMTRIEMGANAAWIHDLKPLAEVGYDLATTSKDFFVKGM
ncbi:MAG: hypothetical protein J5905_03230 [Prevotella sp.]|nr:hypothetical protein [Prevotella sp.]